MPTDPRPATLVIRYRSIVNAAIWVGCIVAATFLNVALDHPPGLLGVTFATGWMLGRGLPR